MSKPRPWREDPWKCWYVNWLLDRDPEYAKRLIAQWEAAAGEDAK